MSQGTYEYDIELQQITQLLGLNIKKKNYIIKSIVKHFSNSKYAEYERDLIDNIKLDMETIGRKYFDVIYVKNREDILNFLKITKMSMLMKYINAAINDYDMQLEVRDIDDALEKIFIQINDSINENIMLQYDVEDVFAIVQQSKVKNKAGGELEELESIELLKSLFELAEKLQYENPQKQLIIIENVDHMLDYNEYLTLYKIVKNLVEKRDVWVMFTSSTDKFAIIDSEYISGVNIINDIVYNMPEMDKLKEFIEEEYPCYIKISEVELEEMILPIIHKVGATSDKNDARARVVLKLINASICAGYKENTMLNSMENSFLLA